MGDGSVSFGLLCVYVLLAHYLITKRPVGLTGPWPSAEALTKRIICKGFHNGIVI